MLQKDGWRIIPRTQNQRIYMLTGQWLRRTSGVLPANRRMLSRFGHICRHDTAELKPILQRRTQRVVVGSSQRKTAELVERYRQRMDRPVAVVIAALRRRQKSVGNHHITGVCRSNPRTPGCHGNYNYYYHNYG